MVLNVYLLAIVPKGFFPDADNGSIFGGIRGDQSISFQAMQKKFAQFVEIITSRSGGGDGRLDRRRRRRRGGSATNSGNVFVTLKPPRERGLYHRRGDRPAAGPSSMQGRGRAPVPAPGRRRRAPAGGRAMARYQYTIQADSLDDLNEWVPKITDALQDVPELQDVNSDQQDKGLEVDLKIDRATAARLGLNAAQIDNTLYDAFGQRQVSTIYKDKNQYHVVMEVAPEFWQSPETLSDIYHLDLRRRGQRHPGQRRRGRRLWRRRPPVRRRGATTGSDTARQPTPRQTAARPPTRCATSSSMR